MELPEDVRDKIESFLRERNYELIEIIYRRESREMVLRILVDKIGGGISIEECSELNEAIGTMLDESNIINESYLLEVVSPGLDRPMVSDKDFKRALGRLVRINTAKPFEGKYVNIGKLKSIEPDKIVLEKDNKEISILRECISKAVYEVVF